MGLLKKLENAQAYLKLGGYGFEGSGKTTSLSLIAIGLHRYIKSKKPIGFFDTETGSSYVKPLFDHAGIEVLAVRSRSLKDLGDTIKEAEQACDILIADSLTHPYKELCATYVKNKSGVKFIEMRDWQRIKDAWNNQFAEPYVNSKLHFLWGARAKNLFEDVLDEGASKQYGKEIFKSVQVGSGARAETESSFEPGILVEFSREYKEENATKVIKKSGLFHRRLTVTKDRFMTLDGMTFVVDTPQNGKGVDLKKMVDENPTFKFFLPHVEKLNINGSHQGFNESNSSELFDDEGDTERIRARNERKIMLEEIENKLIELWPSSQSPKDRQARIAALKYAFKTSSWTAITGMSNQELASGHAKLVKGDKSPLFDYVDANSDGGDNGKKSIVDEL